MQTNLKKRFYITNHAQERYIERVNGGNHTDESVIGAMLKRLNRAKDITQKVYDDVPRYILYLYEQYKELGQTILEDDGIIFVAKKREGTERMYDVLTCYYDNNHLDKFKNSVLSREEIFLKIKLIKKEIKKNKV